MSTQDDIRLLKFNVGKRIAALRNSQGMTQDVLGARIGMDRTYISAIESGKKNITYDTLCRIADGLGLAIDVVCEGVDDEVMRRIRHS